MKTLRVTLADILGPAGPSGRVTGEVWARFVGADGQPHTVRYTDGTVVVTSRPRKPINASGYVDFDIVPNDDTTVHADDQGFGVEVGWDLKARGVHGRTEAIRGGKVVEVVSADPAVVQFGLKAAYVPVIPGASYPTTGDVAAALGPKANKGDLVVNVRDFGAVGDGVTDDTVAIQAALASAGPGDAVVIPTGFTCLIAAPLASSVDRLIVTGPGGILCGPGLADGVALTLSGDRVTVDRLTIDGGFHAGTGISLTGERPTVADCTISRLRSAAGRCDGISVVGPTGCDVRGNDISDIAATGDVTVGNNTGATRGVYIYVDSAPTGDALVRDNVIREIHGEEGDAIQIIAPSTGGVFDEARARIERNVVETFNKRGIKVQGSDVRIAGNRIATTVAVRNGSTLAGVNVISSTNVAIEDNDISGPVLDQVMLQGTVDSPLDDITVRRNTLRGGTTGTSYGVYSLHVARLVVADNRIFADQHPIRLNYSSGAVVAGNMIFDDGYVRPNACIWTDANSTNVMVMGNTATGSTTGASTSAAIHILGPSAVIVGNVDLMQTGYASILTGASSRGAHISGNTSRLTARFLHDASSDFTNQTVGHNVSSASAQGANRVFFADATPTTSMATTAARRGDLCINTGASNATDFGWLCTTSGTPGTWRTL